MSIPPSGPRDMRNSLKGLSAIDREPASRGPEDGAMSGFTNKRRNRLKILYYEVTAGWPAARLVSVIEIPEQTISWVTLENDILRQKVGVLTHKLFGGGGSASTKPFPVRTASMDFPW